MAPIDIPAIEEQARKLRAAEIQRINGLFAERARLVASLAAESLGVAAKAMSDALRPLFSWNPHPSTKPLSLSTAPLNGLTTQCAPCFPGIPRADKA